MSWIKNHGINVTQFRELKVAKILVIEDDQLIGENVKLWLEKENHTVDLVKDGSDGFDQLLNYKYDLAIIDWNLPGLDGASICRKIRTEKPELPMLMLTAKSSLNERVFGLESGAFDYLIKPCSLTELSARVRALLRRIPAQKDQLISHKNLSISANAREVLVNQRPISLSPTEFDILMILCKEPNIFLQTNKLLSALAKNDVSSQLIRVHITNLRRKLLDAEAAVYIVGQKGAGYGLFLEQPVEEV